MVQNNDRAELVNALKCLRDNDIAHLPQDKKDILLNADEEALIQAYYDMDGEFSRSKCYNLDNPYLSIPLALCCCATSVAMVGGPCYMAYKVGGNCFESLACLCLSVGVNPMMAAVPVAPAKYAVELVTKKSKVQNEDSKIQEKHAGDDLKLDDINNVNDVRSRADNIFLAYLKYVCSLHAYTATDKICIKGLIQQFCSAKKMRHSNNFYANINLSASDDLHIQ